MPSDGKIRRQKNLTKFDKMDKDKHLAISAKGGVNSANAKKERKRMREQLEMLLSLPLQDVDIKERLKALGIDESNSDNQMAVVVAAWERASAGDMKAFELIRDTIGEKPTEKYEQSVQVKNPYEELTTEELKRLAGE